MSEEKLELQFERAELDGAPPPAAPDAAHPPAVARVACGACGNHVRSYFTVNGATTCQRCHDAAVASHHGLAPLALLKALGLGLVAAAVGALVYYGVAKITGYEIGLVAIAVGLLVGGAVRLGSGGRGGWRYQALAMGLCYLSVAMSYGAFVFQELAKRQEAKAAAVQTVAASDRGPAARGAAAPAGAADAEAGDEGGRPGAGELLLELAVFILKLPVLIGLDSPMAFVLLAIALWEAWKLNVARPFVAAGPFAVGAPAA